MMRKIKDNKILTIASIFALIGIITIVYAVFTSSLNINGTGVNRKSNFDIYFNNVSNFLTTGTASVTDSNPTVRNHTTVIEDYEATLVSPTDSIYFTFDIVNDGDYDATLTDLTLGPVKCSVNGDETDISATNVCSNIEYTMKYTDSNSNVSLNDTIASKETKEVKVTLTYKEFSDSSKLPTSNVTISNLGIDMVYTADSEAKTNSDGSTPYQKPTAVSTLLSKSNDVSATYTSGSETSHQMYAFEHPATEQTGALTDYRYIGNDPYNYVDFNGETWRIIGIFTVEDGNGNTSQRIKIIKDEKLSSNMAWDSNNVNEWTTASLNAYLNGDYYNGLSSTAKEMIEPAKTYLGGGSWDDVTHYGTAEDMYAWERGTTVYSGRSLKDTKNITLAYPSDYTYTYAKEIDNTCYSDGYNCDTSNPSKGWLYKSSYYWWTVSPNAVYSFYAFVVSSTGYVCSDDASDAYGVRPVTYLISDISFEGNHIGSFSDHYVLTR